MHSASEYNHLYIIFVHYSTALVLEFDELKRRVFRRLTHLARLQEVAQDTYLLIIEFQHIAPYERLLNDFPRIPVLSQVDIENLEGSHRSHSVEKIVYGLAGDSVALGQ